jgi:TRAP transporter TAXI family solute receptor
MKGGEIMEKEKIRMKRIWWVGLCLVLVLALVSWTGAAEAPKKITFIAGTVGGPWYNSAAAIAQILMKDIPGLNVTATSGVSIGNIRLVDGGVDAQLGWTYLNSLHMAINGEDPFKKKHTKVAVVLPGHLGSPFFVATKKSGIKDWADMKNKRILTPPLAGANEIVARRTFELYGFTYKDIKAAGGSVNHIEFNQAADLMKDGRADAVMVPGQPHTRVALLLDLENTVDIVFPTIREDILKKFCEQNPGYTPYPLPAGLYKSLDKPVMIAAGICIMITNRDFPDEFVYQITKAIYTNRKKLQEVDKLYNYIEKENLKRGVPEELFHPGALKLIKEVLGK